MTSSSGKKAQRIESFPVNVQGRLDGAADIDKPPSVKNAGERRVFDFQVRSRIGSAVETRMIFYECRRQPHRLQR
jgi:hypothetical protein